MEWKTPEEENRAIREWAARWKAVNEAEIEELRRTPLEEKVRAVLQMMAAAEEFGWDTQDPAYVQAMRSTWNRIRERLGEGPR